MKITLAFLLCSYVAESCLPPYIHPIEFDSEYDCMIAGYSESLKKIESLGRREVSKYVVYIKFMCSEKPYILKKEKDA